MMDRGGGASHVSLNIEFLKTGTQKRGFAPGQSADSDVYDSTPNSAQLPLPHE
jgi:hypothetical protein